MSRPRQTTLFQSWRGGGEQDKKSSQPAAAAAAGSAVAGPSRSTGQMAADQFGDDEEDEDLLLAMEMSLAESRSLTEAQSRREEGASGAIAGPSGTSHSAFSGLFTSVAGKSDNRRPASETTTTTTTRSISTSTSQKTCNPSSLGLFKKSQPKQGTLFKYNGNPSGGGSKFAPQEDVVMLDDDEEPEELTEEQLSALENIPGFDKGAGQMWIYPTNYPVRDYQFSIVRAALFTNTLVVLPTGLGKTFIAAVVMYNFYRWYPQGKVIFMAPTKPLVAQQIEACHNIMGIPQRDTAEMTGAMQPAERKRAWQARRVFFLTPQVLTNDLTRDACPALLIKCLVVDEAHKSLGNHAYCQVVRELSKYEGEFRVLALSATPGSDMKAVQQVITNIMVSHIELRGEDSPDIKPYTHERSVEKVVVPLGAELTAVKEKYLRVMTMVINRLKRLGVIYNREVTSFSKFLILKSRESFRQNPPHNLPQQQFGAVEGDFALAISLYHGYDLLQQHGLRSLQSYLLSIVSGDKGYGRTRAELLRNSDFTDMMEDIKKFAPVKSAVPSTQQTQSASQLAAPFEIGHPKMKKLQEIALDHFNNFDGGSDNTSAGSSSTRVMIFAQYRDSVNEITEMLNRHRPLIKCMSFIGQSSAGKATKGFTQKEQLKVMRLFREGGYNTLVSTCVGEEGLDIGDVDLIICFDAHKSPIRLVQRMGRTGRKRKGRIIMLVTAGKEEQIYNQSQYSKRSIFKAIQNGAKSLVFYPNSNRMVPDGLQPRCHKMHITVKESYQPRIKGSDKTADRVKERGAKATRTSVAGKKSTDGGFLNEEELRYWSHNFKVKDEEVYKLPESGFISLKTNQPAPVQSAGPHLSLSEWMPWQNRLQDTIIVDHSVRTRHLVEVVEFMQVQTAIGGGEDTYGQEMQMFLNKDDVIVKTTNKPQGLLRYCTPIEGTSGTGVARPNQDGVTSKRPRRSENLPTFSSGDEDFADESDDDLPIFDGERISPKKTPPKKTTTCPTLDDSFEEPVDNEGDECEEVGGCFVEPMDVDGQLHPVSTKGKGKGKTSKKKDGQIPRAPTESVKASFSKPKETSVKTTKGKGKGKKSKQKGEIHGLVKKSPKEDSDVNSTNPNKKVKKRKRHSSDRVNRSVIPLIEDPADEDFEDVPKDSQQIAAQTKITPDKNAREELPNSTGVDQENPPESPELMVIDSDSDREAEVECVTGAAVPLVDHNSDLSQVLPFFTPHKEFLETNPVETTPSKMSTLHRVATPPPLEVLQDALDGLACRGRLSPVDVLSLIDKWERDKTSPPESPQIIARQSTSKELPNRKKVSTVSTPVKISSAWGPKRSLPIAFVSPSTSQTTVSESVPPAVSDDNVNEDPFFETSMVVDEPYEQYKEARRASDRSVSSVSDHHSSVTQNQHSRLASPQLGRNDTNQDVGQTSNVSDASSTSEKIPSPVTPFLPMKTRGLGLGSNTSTPVYNSRLSKLVYSPMVSQVSKAKENKTDASISPDPANEHLDRQKTPPAVPAHKSNVSLVQDSFYGDFDDSVFAAIETPQDTPHEVKSCTRVVGASIATTPDMLTFTQALACVNDSVSNSRSSHSATSKSPSPGPAPDGRTAGERESRTPTPERTASANRQNYANHREESKHPKTARCPQEEPRSPVTVVAQNTSCMSSGVGESKPQVDTSPVDLADPDFDLGFDFEDFDEEMVIPPSPQAACSTSQGFSQRLRGAGGRKSSQGSHARRQISMPDDHTNMSHSIHRDLPEAHDDYDMSEGNRSPSLLEPDHRKNKPSVNENHSPDLLGVASEEPPHLHVDLTDSLAAIFADDGDSEELFCDEEESDLIQPESPKRENHGPAFQTVCDMDLNRAESPQLEGAPAKPDFKTPVKPAPKAQRTGPIKLPVDIGVSDDSPILPRQKRKRAVVTSDDDSPVVVRSRKRITPVIDLTMMGEDDDDDFVGDKSAARGTSRVHPTISKYKEETKQRKRPPASKCRQVSAAAAFLDVEAERSEDDCSEDESDNSDQDQFDNSFINDFSQMSQTQANPADMRAVYLQSVRSPVRSGGCRFSAGRDPHLDVFSQVAHQDSSYMEDSFVVDGEESGEDIMEVGDGEITLLDADVTMSRQTRRQARVAAARRVDQRRAAPPKTTRRRVVHRMDSSSEEEEVVMRNMGAGRMDRTMGQGPRKVPSKTAPISTSSSSSSPQQESTSEEEVVERRRKGPPRVLDDTVMSPTGVTQLPPLHQRCRLNMQTEASSLSDRTQFRETIPKDTNRISVRGNDVDRYKIRDRSKLANRNTTAICSSSTALNAKKDRSSTQLQPRKSVLTNISNNDINNSNVMQAHSTGGPIGGPPVNAGPTFSLGMDFFDDNWDDEIQAGNIAETASPALRPAAIGSRRQMDKNKEDPKPISESGPVPRGLSQSTLSERDRRLEIARQRKEEFLRKRQAAASTTPTAASRAPAGHFGSQIQPPTQTPQGDRKRPMDFIEPTPPQSATSLVTPERTVQKDRMVILVDSREITGAGNLMSALRFKHKVQTVVCQLGSCDYILSNRMGVDRIILSAFTNGARKARLVERVREMCEYYDRPCLIIEQDAIKPGEQKPTKPPTHTKYVDSVMAALSHTHVKLLFSDTQEQTAGLLVELAVQEQKKSQAISVLTQLTSPQEQSLRFYLTLPRVSYVAALNLVHGFRHVGDMLRSSQRQVEERGHMSAARATDLRAHLGRMFDPQMLGLRS